MKILKFDDFNEAVLNNKSLDQLKKVREIAKGTDIGDRISDMNNEGENIINIKNVLDTPVETREDFETTNSKAKLCKNTDLGGGILK